MAIVARHWVPSAAVQVQERGAEYLGPVDGADWSEGVGFHRGFFSAFRVRAGKDVWFHFPLPTPVEIGGKPLHLDSVSLLWETGDGAQLTWLVLQHGGMERLPLTERLAPLPSSPEPFEPPELWRQYYPASDRRLTELPVSPRVPLRFGVQLCVLASAAVDRDGLVRFYGAGAAFADGA
ncbi:hypothetical protein ACFSCW_10865 [Sphingomonas tabacisoli]|uniref:Uncharacterized protein n=1 Tax=Sphingomonas tabacisoli TaxID=2249466 RepID=A0ABW4I5Y7_9SPHN